MLSFCVGEFRFFPPRPLFPWVYIEVSVPSFQLLWTRGIISVSPCSTPSPRLIPSSSPRTHIVRELMVFVVSVCPSLLVLGGFSYLLCGNSCACRMDADYNFLHISRCLQWENCRLSSTAKGAQAGRPRPNLVDVLCSLRCTLPGFHQLVSRAVDLKSSSGAVLHSRLLVYPIIKL